MINEPLNENNQEEQCKSSPRSEEVIKKKFLGLPTPYTYGAQDKWMQSLPEQSFDARKMFLSNRHQFAYREIETVEKMYESSFSSSSVNGPRPKTLCLKILKQCDLLHKIDLCITNPENKKLFDIFNKISVEFGGQRVDCIYLQEQYDMNCVIHKRHPTHMNKKSIFPLVLAPLHETNLVSPSLQHHEMVICFEFKNDEDRSLYDISLFGNTYFLEREDRVKVFAQMHEFTTIQSMFVNDCKCIETILPDTNTQTETVHTLTYNLNYFNHPVYCIYLWGFDKSKVKNVSIKLDSVPFYDGAIEPLEHYKMTRIGPMEPIVFFFGEDEFHTRPRTTVNFSRIENGVLELQTTQDPAEVRVHCGGYNIQGFRCMSGMIGLTFSK